MKIKSSFPLCNILMYSHDSSGLGHIHRTLAIANHLCNYNTNVLILTGSSIAESLAIQEQVDFVRIPGIIKKPNGEYQSLSIRIDQERALSIRTNIILATAQTFRPNLFIVDKDPYGLKREVLPTLEWLKANSPQTKSILGLSDILDDESDWQEKEIYNSLTKFYDEIWIYGDQNVYDPVEKYRLPPELNKKVFFTGYIARTHLRTNKRRKIRKQYRIAEGDIFILVSAGASEDGGKVIEHFIDMHQFFPALLPFKSMIVTGPFIVKKKREEIGKKAEIHGIKVIPFHPCLEDLVEAADLVISRGGYNSICEILTHCTPALVIPSETPRREQLIRAICLNKLNLLDFIPWDKMNPLILMNKIFSLIDTREQNIKAMVDFKLTGLAAIQARVDFFKKEQERWPCSEKLVQSPNFPGNTAPVWIERSSQPV